MTTPKPQDQPYLADLNDAQRQAVTHGEGPLLVIAGAGTGKTKTLVSRLAHLINQGVAPEQILLLTFTRRASAEMLGRAGRLCEAGTASRVWGGTFHAVANRLLRTYGKPAGISSDFTVMDQEDAADMINLIRSSLGFSKNSRRFPRKETLVKIYSHTVNAQAQLPAVLAKHFPWCSDDEDGIKEIFKKYVQRKRENNVLDYDDLLLFWHALCAAKGVGEMIADRFEHVLVDEYQDTNSIQAKILLSLRRKKKNIMVVGDDAQSIYSFRAATIRNILEFPEQMDDTTVITLEQNYRSTMPILEASNAVIGQAKERYTKELWSQRESEQKPALVTCVDEVEQCEAVCSSILEHLEQGVPLMDQAVLFRASHHSAQLEIELTRRNIPFHKYGGLKFVEAAHIKDMLAFLRILENPYDQISWFRVLQLMEGVGPKTAQRIMDDLGARRSLTRDENQSTQQNQADQTDTTEDAQTVVSPIYKLINTPPKAPPAAFAQFQQFRSAVAKCQGLSLTDSNEPKTENDSREPSSKPPLPSQLEIIREFYQPLFEQTYENAAIRLNDIEQLQQIAGRYKSRGSFITDLTLDPPASTSDLAQPPHLDEDYLILSTIHSAKGCEWTVVHVIHAADGNIPSDMAVGDEAGVDEERRLFYVAMTRAKDMLYIYCPLRYYNRGRGMGDGHSYAQLTRFLPRSMHDTLELRSVGIEEDPPGGSSVINKLDDQLNDLWG